LFGGGAHNDQTLSSVVDIFNSETNAWSTAELSEAREFLTATTVGNTAIFGGGKCTSNVFNVDFYEAQSDTWTSTNLVHPRFSLAATTIGNLAMFAGGVIEQGSQPPSNLIDVYDLYSNSWSTEALSETRWGLVAVTVGDLAMFAGGQDGQAYSEIVDIYNAD